MAQAKDHFTNNGSLKCSIEFIYLFTLLNFRHCEKIFFKHVVAFFPKPEMLKSTTSDHTDSRSFLSMLIEIVMGTNKQWTKSKELQWQYDIQWQYITSFPLGIKGGGVESLICVGIKTRIAKVEVDSLNADESWITSKLNIIVFHLSALPLEWWSDRTRHPRMILIQAA